MAVNVVSAICLRCFGPDPSNWKLLVTSLILTSIVSDEIRGKAQAYAYLAKYDTMLASFVVCRWVTTALHTKGGRFTWLADSSVVSWETLSHYPHLLTGQCHYQFRHTPQHQCRYPIAQPVHCLDQNPNPFEQHHEHSI